MDDHSSRSLHLHVISTQTPQVHLVVVRTVPNSPHGFDSGDPEHGTDVGIPPKELVPIVLAATLWG